ncbi:hypothetical protein QQF64_014074 [Cirrhinus molitorella]|uniref:Uncharacterized protein n=1 Tax=Cirrhinus molitorella TaxID=172907 RepID=A0ABR3LSY3_9TELE
MPPHFPHPTHTCTLSYTLYTHSHPYTPLTSTTSHPTHFSHIYIPNRYPALSPTPTSKVKLTNNLYTDSYPDTLTNLPPIHYPYTHSVTQ